MSTTRPLPIRPPRIYCDPDITPAAVRCGERLRELSQQERRQRLFDRRPRPTGPESA